MTLGSDNVFPKVILEEVTSDGSATVTPAADHRALFLGEDGILHLKDSAGSVSDVGGSGGPAAFSGCLAYHNTTQTVGASVTALSLNSEDYDTDNYHDTSTNNSRLTVPTTGYYLVTGHVQGVVNGILLIGLRVNGTTQVRGSAVSGVSNANSKHNTSQVIALTAGDYVELWAYQQSSAATGDTTYGENMNSLSVVFLGA